MDLTDEKVIELEEQANQIRISIIDMLLEAGATAYVIYAMRPSLSSVKFAIENPKCEHFCEVLLSTGFLLH